MSVHFLHDPGNEQALTIEWTVMADGEVIYGKAGRWDYALKVPPPSEEMRRYYESVVREVILGSIVKEIDDLTHLLDAVKG